MVIFTSLLILSLFSLLFSYMDRAFKKLNNNISEQKKYDHPIYQFPTVEIEKIESLYKDSLSKNSNEVVIRDRETGTVLSRRHLNDPEVQEALSDPRKIVEK